ncbi:MAG: DUF2207 family protein, partial [Bacilli bacterium]
INSFIIKNFVMQKIIDIVLIIIILIILYKKSFLLVKVYLNKRNKYQRTALGEEKTTYIHALQNFIHDFSNLKDADKKEIVLWNDFLVYAIILEENNKIVDDIIKLLNDDNDFKSILNLFNTFTIF